MIALRYGRFYLSCLAAFTGGHMINYGVIMYAQDAIGSDLLSGIGFGLCFGPPIVLGWYAGVLCDRLAPGRLIHAAQALFVLAALLLWAGHVLLPDASQRVAPLVLAAALAGAGWSFVAPARMATLGQIASSADLKPASVLFNLLVMVGFGLGPVLIAIMRRGFGWPGVFGCAALLFVLSSIALLGVRTRASARPHAPVWTEIREGVNAVIAQPLLLQLMVAAMAGYLAMGPMSVLLPRLASAQLALGELGRGAFLGTLALALIAGGVIALASAHRLHNGRLVFGATVLAGCALAALGSMTEVGPAVALLCVVGIAGGLALSLIVAGIQLQAGDAMRGRILSMYTIISQVVPAASGVAAGALTQAFGVGTALRSCGAVLVAAMLVNAVWMKALRGYRG